MEETQIINKIKLILSQELLINTNNLITRTGIKRATVGLWYKDKCTFTDPNELHNEESMESIFEGTGITALDLDKDSQFALKNKWEIFMRRIFRNPTIWHKDSIMKQ